MKARDKVKWPPFKEILFTYLTITKILYWTNTITAINQSDVGSMAEDVWMRLLNQDIMLIVGVIFFFYLDKRISLKKSKYSNVVEYAIFYGVGYIVLFGIVATYLWILSWFLTVEIYSVGELIAYSTMGYIIVAVSLEIKQFFKKKATSKYVTPIQNTDDKLAMLTTLLQDDILTQKEFDDKKEKLLSIHGGR